MACHTLPLDRLLQLERDVEHAASSPLQAGSRPTARPVLLLTPAVPVRMRLLLSPSAAPLSEAPGGLPGSSRNSPPQPSVPSLKRAECRFVFQFCELIGGVPSVWVQAGFPCLGVGTARLFTAHLHHRCLES